MASSNNITSQYTHIPVWFYVQANADRVTFSHCQSTIGGYQQIQVGFAVVVWIWFQRATWAYHWRASDRESDRQYQCSAQTVDQLNVCERHISSVIYCYFVGYVVATIFFERHRLHFHAGCNKRLIAVAWIAVGSHHYFCACSVIAQVRIDLIQVRNVSSVFDWSERCCLSHGCQNYTVTYVNLGDANREGIAIFGETRTRHNLQSWWKRVAHIYIRCYVLTVVFDNDLVGHVFVEGNVFLRHHLGDAHVRYLAVVSTVAIYNGYYNSGRLSVASSARYTVESEVSSRSHCRW